MQDDLIKAAREGDIASWEILIRDIYPQAVKQAVCLLRDKDLAQDAVQNTMLKVFNNLRSLKDVGAFTGWWRRILTNEIYLLLRLSTRELPGMIPELQGIAEPPVEDTVTLKLEMGQAIRKLPLDQQQIFLEIDVRGVSLKAAADAYDLPLGTVKSRLFRARARLQEALNHYIHQPKERQGMTIEQWDLTDKIYDYLEGNMDAVSKNVFEIELKHNPDWEKEVNKQKAFLTLLHCLTGKITLSAVEIKDKVETVIAKIQDYEEIVDSTSFEHGKAVSMTSHAWFKQPDCYRTDGESSGMGPITIILKDGFMLSWMPAKSQARKITLGEGYREQAHFSFPDSLKTMAENKSSRILGTEYLHGRPVIHVQFSERIPGLGDMNTHHWMDKETWMPILTEFYNVKGELVNRREVRELHINQGLPDSLFELDLPEGVVMDEEESQVFNLPRDITLKEAAQRFDRTPYTLQHQRYTAKHQWVTVKEDQGAIISMYTVLGELNPVVVVTQGTVPHINFPSDEDGERVEIDFAGRKIEGKLVDLKMAGVKSMLTWHDNDFYYTCGGQLERDELLKIPEELTQAAV